MCFRRSLTLLLLTSLGQAAWADNRDRFNQNYHWEPPKVWQEAATTLPANPNGNTSWLVISGGPVYQNQIALDADSLSIGTDAVIRYTLRITSSEGVANISHQGLRCDSREFKLFAIAASQNHEWQDTKTAQWRRIQPGHVPQALLARDYLCEDGRPLDNTALMLARLKKG